MRFTAPYSCWIPALEELVEEGDEVEATGDVAKGLVDQGWQRVDKPAHRKSSPAPEPDAEPKPDTPVPAQTKD
jgi:hypothetical protein